VTEGETEHQHLEELGLGSKSVAQGLCPHYGATLCLVVPIFICVPLLSLFSGFPSDCWEGNLRPRLGSYKGLGGPASLEHLDSWGLSRRGLWPGRARSCMSQQSLLPPFCNPSSLTDRSRCMPGEP
jgi:hypothetical protein